MTKTAARLFRTAIFCHHICRILEQESDTEFELLSVKLDVAVTSIHHTPVIAEFDSDYV